MSRYLRGFLAGILALAWSGPALAAEDMLRVVVYSDSLLSGHQLGIEEAFPARLQRKLQEIGYSNVEVINMGLPGETSTGALEKLPAVLVKRPDIVILEFGINDMLRGIRVEIIYQNLATMVGKLAHENIYVILVGIKAPEHMGYSYGKQLSDAFDRIATRYRVAFYPSVLEGIEKNPELSLGDELHPNKKGVDMIVEKIYRQVDSALRWKWNILQYQKQYQQGGQGVEQIDPPVDLSTPPPSVVKH